VVLSSLFFPNSGINLREKGVAFGACFDFCYFQPIAEIDGLGIELSPANDEEFVLSDFVAVDKGIFDGGKDVVAFGGSKIRVAADDEVRSVWERFAQGLVGFSSHQDVVARSEIFKSLKVSRKLPDELIVFAYDVVFRFGYDKNDFHRASKFGLKLPVFGKEKMKKGRKTTLLND
jgi:hypothetical protein